MISLIFEDHGDCANGTNQARRFAVECLTARSVSLRVDRRSKLGRAKPRSESCEVLRVQGPARHRRGPVVDATWSTVLTTLPIDPPVVVSPTGIVSSGHGISPLSARASGYVGSGDSMARAAGEDRTGSWFAMALSDAIAVQRRRSAQITLFGCWPGFPAAGAQCWSCFGHRCRRFDRGRNRPGWMMVKLPRKRVVMLWDFSGLQVSERRAGLASACSPGLQGKVQREWLVWRRIAGATTHGSCSLSATAPP